MALAADNLELFQPLVPERWRTNRESFELFHERNPQVYEHLRHLALDAVRRGKRKFGFRCIWEITRWELSYGVEGDSMFVMNDHSCPYYARLLMEREPELRGIFNTRELRAP